jgi:hypothetical protein
MLALVQHGRNTKALSLFYFSEPFLTNKTEPKSRWRDNKTDVLPNVCNRTFLLKKIKSISTEMRQQKLTIYIVGSKLLLLCREEVHALVDCPACSEKIEACKLEDHQVA